MLVGSQVHTGAQPPTPHNNRKERVCGRDCAQVERAETCGCSQNISARESEEISVVKATEGKQTTIRI